MNNKFLKDALGWGFVLWLIGYVLGIVLFMVVPVAVIGWIITPIGITITLWVLYKKIRSDKFEYFLQLGVVWVVMAIVLDYIFIVMMFAPEDGYYKLDVYFYYFFALTLPLLVGWIKTNKKDE
jgi:hypothetical protein